MGWPQGGMVILLAFSLLVSLIKAGMQPSPMDAVIYVTWSLIGVTLHVGLLYAGGFWG